MTDFDARRAVDEMADEVRRGRTPPALAELLRRDRADRAWKRGHCHRFVPRQGEPYRASSSFRIEHEQQVLSRRIFDRVPGVRY